MPDPVPVHEKTETSTGVDYTLDIDARGVTAKIDGETRVERLFVDSCGDERVFVYREKHGRSLGTVLIGGVTGYVVAEHSRLWKWGPRPLMILGRIAAYPFVAWVANHVPRGDPAFRHKYWLEDCQAYSLFASLGVANVFAQEVARVFLNLRIPAPPFGKDARAWRLSNGPAWLTAILSLCVWMPTFRATYSVIFPHFRNAELGAKVWLYGVEDRPSRVDERYE